MTEEVNKFVDGLQEMIDDARNKGTKMVVCAIRVEKSPHPHFQMASIKVMSTTSEPGERELYMTLIAEGLKTHTKGFLEQIRKQICGDCKEREKCPGACNISKQDQERPWSGG